MPEGPGCFGLESSFGKGCFISEPLTTRLVIKRLSSFSLIYLLKIKIKESGGQISHKVENIIIVYLDLMARK